MNTYLKGSNSEETQIHMHVSKQVFIRQAKNKFNRFEILFIICNLSLKLDTLLQIKFKRAPPQ